jgi:RIO kinase 3
MNINIISVIHLIFQLDSKISISLKNYRLYSDELLDEDSDPEDRFEANDKEISKIGKSGYREQADGKILTKHDENLIGRKNAGKIMELHHSLPSGDCGNFDFKVSNKVFNELRTHSNSMAKKINQAQLDRKMDIKTNEMGVDAKTRLILYKLINTACILESIDGVISTGKEAIILHGDANQSNEDYPDLPKEVAIKIFSTTLNEFKQRDRYIRDDYRFRGALKQNNRNIIQRWCEKELHNLTRLKKAGIPCPEVVVMKKHVLVMSFIGEGYQNPAPKLKDANLTDAEMICAYEEIVDIMKRMFNDARLVHADFSEFNILWHEGHCVVIDVAQAVEPIHPAALEFLMRDCENITNFFEKHSVPGVMTKEELFFDITKLDPLTTNTTMLERIHMKGEAAHVVTTPQNLDDSQREKVPEKYRLKEFPFDYAWQRVEEMKEREKLTRDDDDFEKIDMEDLEEEWLEVKSMTKKKSRKKSGGDKSTIVPGGPKMVAVKSS